MDLEDLVLKNSLMTTWNELYNKDKSGKYKREANLTLMTLTTSDTKYESTSNSESEEEEGVFSNLSCYDLIFVIQELL